MLKIILTLIIGHFLLQSCDTKPKDNYFFVIKDLSKEIENSKDSSVSFLPFFYGTHNFVLLNDSTIYYHNSEVFRYCGTGIDFTKAPHLAITPKNMTKIELQDLFDVLNEKQRIESRNFHRTLVTISSPFDTIRNSALPIIRFFFIGKDEFVVGVRRCTEEEEVVANAKFTSSPFDPITHKWKNGFDEEIIPLTERVQFTPPEID